MAETDYTVYTDFEQVQRFVRFANKYKTDFLRSDMQQFLDMPMCKLFDFVRGQYTLEEGEQIIRPMHYANLAEKGYQSGDCDDATIFLVSLWLNILPADQILICEAKQEAQDENYCHIFMAVEINGKRIYFDNLPESQFNKLDYRPNCLRITRAADYL